MRICTIASHHSLPQARTLAEDVARVHGGSRLAVLMIDPRSDGLRDHEPFDLLRLGDLDMPGAARLIGAHGWADAAQILRPHLLRLMAADGPAAYLEADMHLTRPLPEPSGVLLVPRVLERLPDDGERPDYSDLMTAGQYSPGCVAVARGSHEFLEWWAEALDDAARSLLAEAPRERLEEQHSTLDPASPELARSLELAPTLFPGAELLRDPAWNVSYWNLHARDAGGAALIHFSGFRPDRPFWLSDRATRVRVLGDPALAELCAERARRLLADGWSDPARDPHAGGRLANGIPFDRRMRRLYAEAAAAGHDFGDIFAPEGSEAFTSWLRQPVAGGTDITRYLYEVYRERPDLEIAYPDATGADAAGLAGWSWVHGQRQLAPPEEHVLERPLAVEVVGYLGDSLGLGEGARLHIAALQAARVPLTTTAVDPDLPLENGDSVVRYGRRDFAGAETDLEPTFNLICVNGDHLKGVRERLGSSFFQGRSSIGLWAWETDVLPASWGESVHLLDEIWVYSQHMADNLGRWAPVPVIAMPPPVIAPAEVAERPPFALEANGYFLFMLDLFSTTGRKNPLGLIDAFTRAFRQGEGPLLVIKTINGGHRPQALDELRHAAAGRDDVRVIDEYVTPAEKAALVRGCRAYVSLHRAEGWGLTLSEAMSLGRPVIATAYSGNLDFMTPATGYLVDYELTKVGPGNDVYPAEGTWADPNLDHAARLMREVWEQPDEAAERGRRAREDVLTRFAPDVVGARARQRLERLTELANEAAASGETAALGVAAASPEAFAELERRIAFDHTRGTGRGGLPGLVRRTLLRAIKPFTHHERELDKALVRALRHLRGELERERTSLRRERSRVRRLEARLDELASGGREERSR